MIDMSNGSGGGITREVGLLQCIRAEELKGGFVIDVLGFNPSVSTETTVWYNGGKYLYPLETPNIVQFVSTNTLDTGVSILVEGLDELGYLSEETIVLTGTIPVLSTKLFSRVNKASTIGEKAFIGTISGTGNGIPIANMGADTQTTMLGFYSIPKGYTGYLYEAQVSVGAGKEVLASLLYRNTNGVFRTFNRGAIYQSSKNIPVNFLKLSELSDIEFRASAQTSTSVNVSMTIILIENK